MARLTWGRTLSSAIVLIPLVVTTGIACAGSSHDLEARVNQLEASLTETTIQLRGVAAELDSLTKKLDSLPKAQLIAALHVIESAGLHEMDEDLQKATQINPLYLGTIRKVKRVVTGTSWPAPLKDKAEAFKAVLTEIETVLTNNDLAASREAVRKVHLVYHPLTDAGWKVVAGQTTD